jgi:hypothetical protein
MDSLASLLERYEEETAFLRRIAVPEEDRRLFTSTPWQGGHRFFRAKNVVCLEVARRLRDRLRAQQPKEPNRAA